MRIEILKQADGSGLLRCTRRDGSVTWQKQANHAAHFALHDLTHYAVETVLGYRRAFFGLVAEGWDIEDVTGKGLRGELPPEAKEAERMVSLFDSERTSGSIWTAEEFNAFSSRVLTDGGIQQIRAERAELFRRWRATAAGETLELEFEG